MPGAFLHPFTKPVRTEFVSIARGRGALLWDTHGREYIDAMGSLWYCAVGHGRTRIADAVHAQMTQIESYSCFDPFTNPMADALAERLASLTRIPQARIFFCSSGSEAVDTAIKLARLSHVMAGHPERTVVISRNRGYHGTNMGGTSAQGIAPNREGYGPLVPDMIQAPHDDIEAMSVMMAEHSSRLAAVIAEPVQGAGGVYPPQEGYLADLRRLCDQHGALLIFDEVITGFGRLGQWTAADFYKVTPDLTTFAKAVTSGYQPLGGVFLGSKVCDALESDPNYLLRHGYTYSGHAAACAAAMVNLDIIEEENLFAEAHRMGSRLGAGLNALAADGVIDHARGEVAVWAAAMRPDQNAMLIRDKMLEMGVITRAIATEAITFCPPLVTTDAEVDRIVDVLATAVADS
jgi:putrescine---pyruvate transaminase